MSDVETSRTRVARVSEEAGERSAAGAAASRPSSEACHGAAAVAEDHGFSSWRALKAEVERRQTDNVALFFEACAKGDVEALRTLLANDPSLVRVGNPKAPHQGWTGLHEAAKGGHADIVRLLLERGANPNAREAGDNTSALHWAAARGHSRRCARCSMRAPMYMALATCTSSTSSAGRPSTASRETIQPNGLVATGRRVAPRRARRTSPHLFGDLASETSS